METTKVTTAVSGAGGAVRPAPSPDGKSLAFVRRDGGETTLWVKDFAAGTERKIYGDLDRDVQETWAVTGVYPNMAWTPDSRNIVFWSGGKINIIASSGGKSDIIPFRITDTRPVANTAHPEIAVAPDQIETKMPRWASVSPNGQQVVFETLGKLWIKPISGGAPRQLVKGSENAFELWPSWSRDGRSIAFVNWTDEALGKVQVVPAGGGGARIVTNVAGHYGHAQFSPDGRTIVFEKREGGYLTAARAAVIMQVSTVLKLGRYAHAHQCRRHSAALWF